jgi:hypothetical protein
MLASLVARWWQHVIVICLHEQNTRAEVNGCKKNVRFKLCRRPFPAKIAFAVKFNNAEGQTLKPVAISLYVPTNAPSLL